MKKLISSLIIFILILTCGKLLLGKNNEKKERTEYKDTFIIAQKSDAKTLDPQKSIDSVSNKIINTIFDTLVKMDENLNIQPSLATSWERVDENTTIFHLRKNVKFHNGDILTSEDVKYSLEKGATSPQTAYLLDMIKEVEIVDKDTVKIITDKPFGPLLRHLSTTPASIVNKKIAIQMGNDFFNHPIGTGQFKLKEWIPGDKVILSAFDENWAGIPTIKTLIFKNIPEVSNRMISLETGEVDAAFDIGIMDRQALLKSSKLSLIEVEAPSQLYLAFDQTNPILKNLKVRQAISYAIDNGSIADAVFKGAAIPANSSIPTAIKGHLDSLNQYNQNIEIAKSLLKEAGFPNGFNMDLWVNDESTRVDMCIIIQDQLKQIGINVNVKVFEWGTYLTKTLEHNKPLYLFSWNCTTVDSDSVLYPMFHSSQRNGSANRSNYVNETVDILLEKARHSINEEQRIKLYDEAQEIIQNELPHYVIVYPKLNIGINNSVKNLIMLKNGYIDISNTYILK